MALLNEVEVIIIQNWRFHLNYFEKFLAPYLLMTDKDEATLVIFPLYLNAICNPKTS